MLISFILLEQKIIKSKMIYNINSRDKTKKPLISRTFAAN